MEPIELILAIAAVPVVVAVLVILYGIFLEPFYTIQELLNDLSEGWSFKAQDLEEEGVPSFLVGLLGPIIFLGSALRILAANLVVRPVTRTSRWILTKMGLLQEDDD